MEEHWFDKYEKIFVKNLFHSKMIWIQDFMETRLTEIYCKIHLSVFCQSVVPFSRRSSITFSWRDKKYNELVEIFQGQNEGHTKVMKHKAAE